MRTVSVSTAAFDGYPMAVAIREIAAAGARSVEPAFIRGYVEFDETAFSEAAAARLLGLMEGEGLSAGAVSAHLDLGLAEAPAMLQRRIAFAARLGSPFLVTNAGKRQDRGAVLATVQSVLADCERSGVTLALENPGHGHGEIIGNARDGAEFLRAVGSPHVRLNYDAGNVFTYSGGAARPEDDLPAALPEIVHLHLKDVAERPEGWVFTPLGEGALDFRALWRRLPPGLPVGIELPLRLERPGRADPRRRPDPVPLPAIRDAVRRSLALVGALDGGTA